MGPDSCVGAPQVAFSPGGRGALLEGCRNSTATLGEDGSFGPTRVLAFPGSATRLALYGRSRAIYGGGGTRPAFAFGKVGAPVDAVQRLNIPKGTVAILDANASGVAAAIVAYAAREVGTTDTRAKRRLYVRAAGGRFRTVTDLGASVAGEATVNSTGDVLVAWADAKVMYARLLRATGNLGPVQVLGPMSLGKLPSCVASAALDATRRAIVAWECRDYSSDRWSLHVAYASPGKRFGAARLVEGGTVHSGFPAVNAKLLRNAGLLVWQGSANGREIVRTADVIQGRATNTVTIPAPPSQNSASLQDVAVGPRGGALILWWGNPSATAGSRFSPRSLFAELRAPDERVFGAPELITEVPLGQNDRNAVAAIDPVTTRAVAVWGETGSNALIGGEGPEWLVSSTRAAP